MEENGKISFLDLLIIRNDNFLKATVYRKKTQLGNVAHYGQ